MDKIIIYTDGACSNNQESELAVGGWAYHMSYKNKTKQDSGRVDVTTNNRMEILSVIEALKVLKKFDIPIEVYSDSNYVVNTINQNWKRKKNHDLWDELDDLLLKFENITFIKVKAHDTNKLNNLVDRLAVEQTKR